MIFEGGDVTQPGNCRSSQIAIFFVLACHAVAQTTPPPGTIKTLYRFKINSANGDSPLGGLILGDDGKLYGATSSGGDKSCRCGMIFQITTWHFDHDFYLHRWGNWRPSKQPYG